MVNIGILGNINCGKTACFVLFMNYLEENGYRVIGAGGYGVYDTLDISGGDLFSGKVHYFVRAKTDTTMTLGAYPIYRLGGSSTSISGEALENISLDNSWRLFYLQHTVIGDNRLIPPDQMGLTFAVAYKSMVGSTNLHRDFELFVPGELLFIDNSAIGSGRSILISENRAIWTNPVGGLGLRHPEGEAIIQGDIINLKPNKHNMLFHITIDNSSWLHSHLRTVAYTEVFVTPRYEVI